MEKLLAGAEREESEHLTFGSAYGLGIAEYFYTQDADRAFLKAWLEFNEDLETEKKNWTKCFCALEASFIQIDNLLQDYDMVTYQDKPASELSFRLNINESYYFVGYIDIVLRNKWTGKYCVLEVKHTGLSASDLRALYENSGQALGYSVALDTMVGEEVASYDIIYFVAQLGKDFSSKIHVLHFEKTLLDRLNWFLTLGLDVEKLERMAEIGVYPKRGDSCMKFNKPCFHFGVCGLSSADVPAVRVEDTTVYDFTFDIDPLIEDHIKRVANSKSEVAEAMSLLEL